MYELTMNELYLVDGGAKTVSDYFLLAGSIAACFVSPYVGIPLTIVVFAAT